MALIARPGTADSAITIDARYGNFIGGEFVPPVKGEYFENISPVTGQVFTVDGGLSLGAVTG